jgi:lipoprotein NlpI
MRYCALILVVLFAATFAAEPEQISAREWVRRGSEELVTGKINEAIRSFEEAIKLQPAAKAHLWQLGIAYYYAERFEDGRKLFELHQTVNERDVENAVWHFICTARAKNLEAAQKAFIPISGDARVPMKEVHALFAGTGTEQQVIEAASKLKDAVNRQNALCYAHLYLALHAEANGKKEAAAEHIKKAAEDYRQDHYMGQIARLHAKLRSQK